jgi:hypothetical protein
VELTMGMPLEIRLPARLDRAALATLRRAVASVDVGGVAVVRGADGRTFCGGISFDSVGDVDPLERDSGLADFEVAVLTLVTSTTRTGVFAHRTATVSPGPIPRRRSASARRTHRSYVDAQLHSVPW